MNTRKIKIKETCTQREIMEKTYECIGVLVEGRCPQLTFRFERKIQVIEYNLERFLVISGKQRDVHTGTRTAERK